METKKRRCCSRTAESRALMGTAALAPEQGAADRSEQTAMIRAPSSALLVSWPPSTVTSGQGPLSGACAGEAGGEVQDALSVLTQAIRHISRSLLAHMAASTRSTALHRGTVEFVAVTGTVLRVPAHTKLVTALGKLLAALGLANADELNRLTDWRVWLLYKEARVSLYVPGTAGWRVPLRLAFAGQQLEDAPLASLALNSPVPLPLPTRVCEAVPYDGSIIEIEIFTRSCGPVVSLAGRKRSHAAGPPTGMRLRLFGLRRSGRLTCGARGNRR